MTALKFEHFTASRRELNVAQAARVLGLQSEDDFGDGVTGPIVVFADSCYALPVGDGSGRIFAPIFGCDVVGSDDDVAWALYWDDYLPECAVEDVTLDVLTDAFRHFCQREKLPHICAIELLADIHAKHLFRPLPERAEYHVRHIEWFLDLWDRVEDAMQDAEAMAC